MLDEVGLNKIVVCPMVKEIMCMKDTSMNERENNLIWGNNIHTIK